MYRILFLLMLCMPGIITAQTTTKKFDHYAGIQVNQLLKQIINLNQNNSVIDNPYLLEYSIIQNKSNFGLRVGFGYTYSKSNNAENPDANLLEENDLSMYLGVCKRISLSPKFELTYGLDYFNDYLSNKSYSYTVNEFGTVDSSYFQNNFESKSHGVGFDISLRYALSSRIMVGTQLTYAYKLSTEKTHDLVFTHSQGFPSETNSLEVTNSYFKSSDFELKLPVAIYLVFKF